MPSEIGPFLAQANIQHRVDIDNTNEFGQQQLKSYFIGKLGNKDVILGMTGIGTKNAEETAQLAFDHLGCISGAVFSGVSGGNDRQFIGDVLVPERWTLEVLGADGNTTSSSYTADAKMLKAATIAASRVKLSSTGYLGDIACIGIDPYLTPTIDFGHVPTISVAKGLTGRSADPFGGHALVCAPATDTFGCQPCKRQQVTSNDPVRLITTARPFITPDFFTWFQKWSESSGVFDVQDMETAAVAKVALGKAPFIGFRSPSDGGMGGPVPTWPGPVGFLPAFFLYRQYASDNAAAVAMAFLKQWKP